MKRFFLLCMAFAAVMVFYLLFWPTPVDAVAWTLPPETHYPANHQLTAVSRQNIPEGYGPEDVAVDAQGRVYGGLQDGQIMRHDPATERWETFANTGGRPLGLHFDAEGNLIVCDAYKGLLAVDPHGNIRVLTTEYGGVPFRFTDDLDIDINGIIYFTDASFKFYQPEWKLDAMEHRPNGRLMTYDPSTGITSLLMDQLCFANGVALSPAEDFVLVNETWNYRVLRYWLKGEKKGTHDVFIEHLPGYPDGISCDGEGLFWLALPSVRNGMLDGLAQKPFMRKVVSRLPAFFHPKPQRFAFFLGINLDGTVVYNLQEPTGQPFAMITSVEAWGDRLYLGSLHEPAYAVIDIDKLSPVQ